MLIRLTTILSTLTLCALACGQPVFEQLETIQRFDGGWPYQGRYACTGDVNGDGITDLLVLKGAQAAATGDAELWLGPVFPVKAPIFLPEMSKIAPEIRTEGDSTTTYQPLAQLHDINGDDRDDLFALNGPGNKGAVWISQPDGHFTLWSTLEASGDWQSFSVTDIDSDGDLDVVALTTTGIYLLRRTDTAFAAGALVDPNSTYCAVGDFDGDNRPDIVTSTKLLRNDGLGSFVSIALAIPSDQGTSLGGVQLAGAIDVDHDGRDELVIAVRPAPILWPVENSYSAIQIVRISPNGQMTYEPPVSTGMSGPYFIKALPADNPFGARFALGSDLGVSFSTVSGSQFAIAYFNDGTLTFSPPYSSGGASVRSIDYADFDGDACSDFLLLNAGLFWGFNGTFEVKGRLGDGLFLARGHCGASPRPIAPEAYGAYVISSSSGTWFRAHALGDIDNDGWADLVVARSSSPTQPSVLMFRNMSGRFDFQRPLFLAAGTQSVFVRLGVFDEDDDGNDDICGFSTLGTPQTLKRSPAPVAIPPRYDSAFAVISQPTWFTTPVPTTGYSSPADQPRVNRFMFDADADGSEDFIWVDNFGTASTPSTAHRVIVQRRNGPETRTLHSTRFDSVAPLDVDGDGDIDLIGVERPSGVPTAGCECWTWADVFLNTDPCDCFAPSTLKALLNDGHGSFAEYLDTKIPIDGFSDATELRASDLNNDGKNDLLLLNASSARLLVWLTDASGLSHVPRATHTEIGLYRPVLGDVDRDGDLDIVAGRGIAQTSPTTMDTPSTFTTLLNDGTGAFELVREYPRVMYNATLPQLTDIDRDGDIDLTWIAPNDQIAISKNLTPPPPCPTDLNADRTTNTTDLTLFLVRFGQTAAAGSPAAPADINADGVVNTSDLVLLLVRFGKPCL